MCGCEVHLGLRLLAAIEPPSGISHEGYISIMITTLGVVVGVFALIVGAMAIIGYGAIMEAAKKRAEDCATEVANSRIEDVARKAATDLIEKFIRDERLDEKLTRAFEESKSPLGESNRVGEPYPGQEDQDAGTREDDTGPDHP